MKVEIATRYNLKNYGNRLQNYAIQEVLKKLNVESTTPNPESLKKEIFYNLKYLVNLITFFKFTKDECSYKYLNKKQSKFKKFNNKFLNMEHIKSNHVEKTDFFIIGSDQVWNPYWKFICFLPDVPPAKKVCFSPSFGVNSIPDDKKEYFRENLLTINNISVREKDGAKIIKELTGKDAEVLIDPTLMLNKEEWDKIAAKPKKINTNCKYAFLYFLGDIPEKASIKVEELKKDGYTIYDIQNPENINIFKSGPSEFLYLLKHSTVVLTDSFHACVFSFIYEKPLLLYSRTNSVNMLSRMDVLFNTFDLKRKYVDSGLPNDMLECDYSIGQEKLKAEQDKVYKFLKKSMNLE